MAGSVAAKSELLNVLGDVKARVQDKLGVVGFPMPQFILIGKQSVGKSRLIEALAGEQFNFCSGTLGSRRPTVLEFRNTNMPCDTASRWFVRDRQSNKWGQHPIDQVMQLIGAAHEELGADVSPEPVYCRIESPVCVDMTIVDLPGFRDFALDRSKQGLADKIEALVTNFMQDQHNVMLCVEEAGDASTMSTLAKCRELDPHFQRTVLIRNKLDKYYTDLSPENVNQWLEGFGDLPPHLRRFALTLPHFQEGIALPKPFSQLREEMNTQDLNTLCQKGVTSRLAPMIGFNNFASFMEKKIEQMFVDALAPVMMNLKELKQSAEHALQQLEVELLETDPLRILSTTRDCGASFGSALTHVMEGILGLKTGAITLEQELLEFHEYHKGIGSNHFCLLPSEEFDGLADYIEYLKSDIQVGACDVLINGGAQYRRLMMEVEIFIRFSEIAAEISKQDVIQARGVSMGSLTWRDVVVKLLSKEAHHPLRRRVMYIGERIKWFFRRQKEPVLEFMDNLERGPARNMYSPLYPKHAKLIKQNDMIKQLVFETYDRAIDRQLKLFVDLFDNVLSSTFSNPWVFLKGVPSSALGKPEDVDMEDGGTLASFEETKSRIPKEIELRSNMDTALSTSLSSIPTEPHQVDEAVEKVQQLVQRTYGFIRSQVCDQVEILAESFFKLPMLRRLEEDMSLIVLAEGHQRTYEARRERLTRDVERHKMGLMEIGGCIDRLQSFALKVNSGP